MVSSQFWSVGQRFRPFLRAGNNERLFVLFVLSFVCLDGTKTHFNGKGIQGIGVRRGVSKGVEDSHRPSALWASHSRNGHEAICGVARSQGVKGLGMAGPGETLGSPWPVATPCHTPMIQSQGHVIEGHASGQSGLDVLSSLFCCAFVTNFSCHPL
jgi:hypothetical protein